MYRITKYLLWSFKRKQINTKCICLLQALKIETKYMSHGFQICTMYTGTCTMYIDVPCLLDLFQTLLPLHKRQIYSPHYLQCAFDYNEIAQIKYTQLNIKVLDQEHKHFLKKFTFPCKQLNRNIFLLIKNFNQKLVIVTVLPGTKLRGQDTEFWILNFHRVRIKENNSLTGPQPVQSPPKQVCKLFFPLV